MDIVDITIGDPKEESQTSTDWGGDFWAKRNTICDGIFLPHDLWVWVGNHAFAPVYGYISKIYGNAEGRWRGAQELGPGVRMAESSTLWFRWNWVTLGAHGPQRRLARGGGGLSFPIRLVGERAAAEQEIVEDFLARGWIEPRLASKWASNGFDVPKKEKGKWRLVVDYRQLNEATLPDAHSLPLIEIMLENQSKHKIFTIVDLSKGFHPIPLHPESGAKTAKNLAGKRYQWRVMPMGSKNGPAISQRVMDNVLQGLDCADVYIDDTIIGYSGDTEEELLTNRDHDVRAVLNELRREELVASVSKTDFFVRSVEFCGRVLENGTRQPAPGKMLALERWTKPDNVRELRGFLGLADYYSGHVQNYASIATPLINMLKDLPKHKNGKKIGLTWNASAN